MTARDRNIALHEAGHAVASCCLQCPILGVTIIPQAGSLGHVKHAPINWLNEQGAFHDTPDNRRSVESRIVISYSGPLASRKFQPRSYWRKGGRSDFITAKMLMDPLQCSDKRYNSLYERLLWRRAELLVDERWHEINAVADALLSHGMLDLKELEETILSAFVNRPKAV